MLYFLAFPCSTHFNTTGDFSYSILIGPPSVALIPGLLLECLVLAQRKGGEDGLQLIRVRGALNSKEGSCCTMISTSCLLNSITPTLNFQHSVHSTVPKFQEQVLVPQVQNVPQQHLWTAYSVLHCLKKIVLLKQMNNLQSVMSNTSHYDTLCVYYYFTC